jgi:hypothetical protein
MLTQENRLQCQACGEWSAIEVADPVGEAPPPCPHCGSHDRICKSVFVASDEILTGEVVRIWTGKRDKKRPSIEIHQHANPQRNRGGRISICDRCFDRDNDLYSETVMMRDTGEMIHRVREPLSRHRGHGSDKKGNAS